MSERSYAAWMSGRAGPLDGRLQGTGRVADDLYLMAHHDVTGRPLLPPRSLGLGLAGGLLAELMLARSITVRPDSTVAAGRDRPGDDLARGVHDRVLAEPRPLPMRDWLPYLALTAAGQVAVRLGEAGYLVRARGVLPWRPPRWVPADPDWAFMPQVRVRAALDGSAPWSGHGAVLAGLAIACGLGFRISQSGSSTGTLKQMISPLGPALQELIAQTVAAAGSSVLSGRA